MKGVIILLLLALASVHASVLNGRDLSNCAFFCVARGCVFLWARCFYKERGRCCFVSTPLALQKHK
jgi:hypothetical protein